MDSGLTSRESGELLTDVRYLKDCCEKVQEDIEHIKEEQSDTKTRTIWLLAGTLSTLVLGIVTFALNYARIAGK